MHGLQATLHFTRMTILVYNTDQAQDILHLKDNSWATSNKQMKLSLQTGTYTE